MLKSDVNPDKALVWLSFDWVPKLIQKSFQTMEQNLVQRCETKVDADTCKVKKDLERLERAGLLRDGSMLLAVQKCHLCSTKNSC